MTLNMMLSILTVDLYKQINKKISPIISGQLIYRQISNIGRTLVDKIILITPM